MNIALSPLNMSPNNYFKKFVDIEKKKNISFNKTQKQDNKK